MRKQLISMLSKGLTPEELKQIESARQQDPLQAKKANTSKFTTLAIILSVVLICLCVWFMMDTLATGAKSAVKAYEPAKTETAEEVYNNYYNRSYAASEKAHHVSNDITISVGQLREEQKLEVLKVSEVDYKIKQDTKDGLWREIEEIFTGEAESWYEIPGYGIFTVNLQTSEFIIDNDHKYVIIRVPSPELTEFSIDYENVKLLHFEKGGIFKDSAKVGVENAMTALKSAELTMRQKVFKDQEFCKKAMDAAENMLTNLVKQLNPHIPDLVVEVEFFN